MLGVRTGAGRFYTVGGAIFCDQIQEPGTKIRLPSQIKATTRWRVRAGNDDLLRGKGLGSASMHPYLYQIVDYQRALPSLKRR